MKSLVHCLPRILAILYIVFISLFALDVFGQPQWFLALLMHLIPSFVLIILTVVAWKKPSIGGVLFLIAGLVMTFYFHTIAIIIPVYVIGVLFLVEANWKKIKKLIF